MPGSGSQEHRLSCLGWSGVPCFRNGSVSEAMVASPLGRCDGRVRCKRHPRRMCPPRQHPRYASAAGLQNSRFGGSSCLFQLQTGPSSLATADARQPCRGRRSPAWPGGRLSQGLALLPRPACSEPVLLGRPFWITTGGGDDCSGAPSRRLHPDGGAPGPEDAPPPASGVPSHTLRNHSPAFSLSRSVQLNLEACSEASSGNSCSTFVVLRRVLSCRRKGTPS